MASVPHHDTDTDSLSGYRVLVIEDDYLVAQDLASTLRERGALVLGPAPNAARARALAEQSELDCALLDVNLKGQFVFDLAYSLIDKGVHTIVTTGYDLSFLPADLRHVTCLQKPVDTETLVGAIRMVDPRVPSARSRRNERTAVPE
jgi:DNA-binding response OmpR family regulator